MLSREIQIPEVPDELRRGMDVEISWIGEYKTGNDWELVLGEVAGQLTWRRTPNTADSVRFISARLVPKQQEILDTEAELEAREAELEERLEQVFAREADVMEQQKKLIAVENACNKREEEQNKRAEHLQQWEDKLDAREPELRARAAKLYQQSKDIDKRIEKVSQREATVVTQEAVLKDTDAALSVREASVKLRENAALQREQDSATCLEQVTQRENEVARRENELVQWSMNLDAQEQALTAAVKKFEENRSNAAGNAMRDYDLATAKLELDALKKQNAELQAQLQKQAVPCAVPECPAPPCQVWVLAELTTPKGMWTTAYRSESVDWTPGVVGMQGRYLMPTDSAFCEDIVNKRDYSIVRTYVNNMLKLASDFGPYPPASMSMCSDVPLRHSGEYRLRLSVTATPPPASVLEKAVNKEAK